MRTHLEKGGRKAQVAVGPAARKDRPTLLTAQVMRPKAVSGSMPSKMSRRIPRALMTMTIQKKVKMVSRGVSEMFWVPILRERMVSGRKIDSILCLTARKRMR